MDNQEIKQDLQQHFLKIAPKAFRPGNLTEPDLEFLRENFDDFKTYHFPFPLNPILELLSESFSVGFSRKSQLLYALLSKLERELENQNCRYSLLSIKPEKLAEIASNKIFCKAANLKSLIRKISNEKCSALKNGFEIPNQSSLPDLAFPIVVDRENSVIWGEFERISKSKASTLKLYNSGKGKEVEAILKNILGLAEPQAFFCNSIDFGGIDIGNSTSWSLGAWLSSFLKIRKLRLPFGKTAVTGLIEARNGELNVKIEAVDDIEIKVKTALSSGFNRIIIPLANLKELNELKFDDRILPFDNLFDLMDWLKLNDPRHLGRAEIESFAAGKKTNLKISSTIFSSYCSKELSKGRLNHTIRRLKYLCKRSHRNGKSIRWAKILNKIRRAIYALLSIQGNDSNFHLLNLMRLTESDSIWLLHLPYFLKNLGEKNLPAAFNLYDQLGHRQANHDMNLILALHWGRGLFHSKEHSPWANKNFRARFPLLCWFLFSDCLECLLYLTSWEDLSIREKSWKDSVFEELQKMPYPELTDSEKTWDFNSAILKTACAKDLKYFDPTSEGITELYHRPLTIAAIIADNSKNLEEKERTFLSSWLDSFKSQLDKKRDTLNKIRKIELNQGHGKEQIFKIKEETWLEIFSQNLPFEEISRHIRSALLWTLSFKRFTPLQSDSFKFVCFSNPALALSQLAIAWKDKFLDEKDFCFYWQIWVKSVSKLTTNSFGYRQPINSSCLFFLAGKLAGKKFLPRLEQKLKNENITAYWAGFYFSKKILNQADRDQMLASFRGSIKRYNFANLIWLFMIKRKYTIKQAALETFYELSEKPKRGEKLNHQILFLLLASVWPKEKKLQSFSNAKTSKLLQTFKNQPLNCGRNKDVKQAILPFAINQNLKNGEWKKEFKGLFSSRGFSPLGFLSATESSKNICLPLSPTIWRIEWEKEIYITINLIDAALKNDPRKIKKIILSNHIGFSNSIFGLKLLEKLKSWQSL